MKMIKCYKCKGTGKITEKIMSDNFTYICKRCNGKGVIARG